MGVFYKGWNGDSTETLKPVEDSAEEGDKTIFFDAVVGPTAIDD